MVAIVGSMPTFHIQHTIYYTSFLYSYSHISYLSFLVSLLCSLFPFHTGYIQMVSNVLTSDRSLFLFVAII